MENDKLAEIGIDKENRLYLKPFSVKFPYIYREAMEVHWDGKNCVLYSPKPKEWSYLDWFNQIMRAAKEQSCCLEITTETRWANIPDSLKTEILEQYSKRST